jgi:class 3 adenylate cyclase/tetratricopeptide (TPR) repeat protein
VSFSEDIDRILRLLRDRRRVSLRAIALELGADADYARSIRDEIVDVLGLAQDEGAGVLTADSTEAPGSQSPAAPPRRDERFPATAERRLLTFMFCDLVSSTPLSTRLDPEDLRQLMLGYQRVCTDAIERFEGHISQWVGDGVVTYFGFPEAHEDDAVRAVHASLAIVDAVARLPAAVDGSTVAVRLGVHTGWSIVGDQGGGRSETLAFGEAPNICARIQACAEPNTVLVSETTFALTKGFFEFVDLDEFNLKGVSRRVRLYRAVGSTGAGDRFDVVRDQGLMPLVNRTRERDAVSLSWHASVAGDSRALLIVGEAGIGKSRLVHFARELVVKPAQVLEFRGSPYHRLSSLRAVSRGLRRFWDLGRLSDVEIQATIAARLDVLDITEPFAAALLQRLLGAGSPEHSELVNMTPVQIRALTFELIGSLVRQVSNSAPLLLIVEDMHWLDPSSEELLRLLLQHRKGSKAFFLMTARPQATRLDLELPGVEHVTLEGLAREESIELVRLAMTPEVDANELAEMVVARSEGNPLFIEELSRTISLMSASAGRQEQIPYTLQSTLRAHLDGVGAQAREAAEWGAVIGARFDPSLLAAASGIDADSLSARLRRLVQSHLLRRVPDAASERYEFRHALQQEACVQGMLRSVARSRHLAVANAILKDFPDLAAAEPERVARHFREAGDLQQELNYRIVAAERAISKGAYQEALAEIGRCVDLLGTIGVGGASERVELRVRLAQGNVYLVTKGQGSVEAKEAFDRAFALARDQPRSSEVSRALFGLWTFYFFRGDASTSLLLSRDLLASAEAAGFPETRMMAHFACSASEQLGGRFQACVTHAEAVLKLHDPNEAPGYVARYAQDPRVTAMTNACIALAVLGQIDRARQLSDETVAHARALGHEFVLSIALQIPAFLAVHLGDVDSALEAALEWAAVADRQGNPVYKAMAASVVAWARAKKGEGDALALLRGVREGFLAQGVALVDPLFVTMLADAALAVQDAHQGVEILDSFNLGASGARAYEAEHMRLSAALSFQRGDSLVEVRGRLESAFAAANDQGARLFALRAALDLGDVIERLGEASEARGLVSRALESIQGDCAHVRAAKQWLLRTEPLTGEAGP